MQTGKASSKLALIGLLMMGIVFEGMVVLNELFLSVDICSKTA